MLRERKRPDYELIVFKYRIWPLEIPQELWVVAKEQQRIWNEMTECFTATMDASKELTDKDEKTALFTAYHQKIKDIYQASPIHCDARQAVYERFVETVKRYLKGLKNKGGEGLQNGKPRVKKGLDRINIPFNDRTGGKETDFLFGRCKRFSLKEKPFPETTVGKFLLGNQYMRFKAVIHRPLPKDAIFKRLSLVGEFTPSFGWDWYITLLLEVSPKSPAVRIDLPSTGRTAALDIGWRIFEEYIRIGVIADSDGNVFELRLPMDRTNGKIASQIEWLTAKKGEHDMKRISFDSLRTIGAEIDADIEKIKKDLKALFPQMPDALRPSVQGWHMSKGSTLKRLCRQMEDYRHEFKVQPAGLDILQDWRRRHVQMRRRETFVRQTLMGSRDFLYQQIAVNLAENYDRLVWEGDLNLKKLAETTADGMNRWAIENAQKFRHLVAPSTLKQKIAGAFRKRNREIVPEKTAFTTITCFQCGATMDPTPKLEITCATCGYSDDQDITAARNLLRTVIPEIEIEPRGSTAAFRGQAQDVFCPL